MLQELPTLRTLLDALSDRGVACSVTGSADRPVTGITADSRAVESGFVFAALKGVKSDGAAYAPAAAANGAAAILAANDADLGATGDATVIRAEEPRRALAMFAAAFHGAQPETAVAVTGTSGKTSVVDFTRQLWRSAGLAAASIGTVGVIKPDGAVYGSLTTPDPVTLHQSLASLAREGVTHLAFEASSHGLDQYRLDGVKLTAGAFTNLGRDHLDYHPNIEAYFDAKMRLFEDLLQPGQTAVINTDGARANEVAARAAGRGLELCRVGTAGDEIRLAGIRRDGFRQILDIEIDGAAQEIELPLIGGYQVENALVAAGLALHSGLGVAQVAEGLSKLAGVPGRLEIAGKAAGGLAVIDYAHKPEALSAALDAVRPFATSRIILVVGCGGDRDRGKRPIMGRIAASKADVVIITDDNPRTEDPASIRSEILADSPGAMEIGNRRTAIRAGVCMLAPGDVLLVAGKGHETGQTIGTETLPFSDHEEVAAAIAARAPRRN